MTTFTLDPLPYALDALEPYISKETLEFHYGKHHQGYVTKLNALLAQSDGLNRSDLTLEDLLTESVQKESRAVFNNAAQVWNHSFYWKGMRPAAQKSLPHPQLLQEIESEFSSWEAFKTKFSSVAASHFGSGWVWLVRSKTSGKLEIQDTHDALNPLVDHLSVPLLVLDVWEHAYYIDKRNNRLSYINDWFELINWDFVAQNDDK